MFLLEKSKPLQALSRKKDFDLLKKKALPFSCQWLKALFLYEEKAAGIKPAWSLPKKYVSDSVTRNRLKRWGRENLRKSPLKGFLLLVFFQRERGFYKKLRRKDFDYVFNRVLEKIQSGA